MIHLDHKNSANSRISHSYVNSIGQSLASSTNVIRRRPARSILGSFLFALYVYFFLYQGVTRSESRQEQPLQPQLDEIPSRIWQIFFGYTPLSDFAPALQTWISNNQDYSYTLMSDQGANEFARKHYADRPDILGPFLQLEFHVLRSDLLRYMILESEGGIYSDLDTVVQKSVRDWIPQEMRSKVHAVVGVEYDQLDGEPYYGMNERIQFCQWTMAASRGHPIMKKVVKKVVAALNETVERDNISIADFQPSDDEVIQVSGPVIWTHAVMEAMSEATGTEMSYLNVTGMTEARLFGDVLVLPIDGFGAGQPHSNSTRDENQGAGDFYVRHQWKGSWKHGWNG
ncbi:hypothetical protein IMSHALPRED_006575 [Imshaugia aleurites]|uniref:Initiation-specific alpha-1,6-mannosyltransferase n=1 Tax=Imshaugia aleurites TaxID=172621 RepID=A0A8H3ELH8_9LECA|nr:hypothetical protein IMSHALPRED_006575 [Imshaugia aleurites]